MNQSEWTRRAFMYAAASGVGTAATVGQASNVFAASHADALKIWANPGVHQVGSKDWSAMSAQGGLKIAATAKSARADEAIQKMVVGDGNKLFDAITDNGGGMEDAMASQKAIVPLDTSKIPNWKNILPVYNEGGLAAHTIRYKGKVYSTPMISNADSMAYDYKVLGFHPDSWGLMCFHNWSAFSQYSGSKIPLSSTESIFSVVSLYLFEGAASPLPIISPSTI